MAWRLGPGGRGLLVLFGLAVMALGALRAGWLPDLVRGAEGRDLPRGEAFVRPLPVAACDAPLRISAPPRAAVLRLPAGVELQAVEHGAAALARLAGGEVDGAVASVAEVAAALPAEAWIAEILGGGADLVVVAAEPVRTPATIAAPVRSAEAFLAAAAGAETVAVEDAAEALRLLGAGRVAAAALPRWRLGPAGPVGRPAELAVAAPLDPVVLVVGRKARCLGQESGTLPRERLEASFGRIPEGTIDRPGSVAELVRAWAGQRQMRPSLPPLELVTTPALVERIWGGGRRSESFAPARLEEAR